MAKYIRCCFCDKKIMFGETAYHKDFCGAYCSIDCYFDANGSEIKVDEHAEDLFDCAVYDDDARKEEIRKEMEEHRVAMAKLYDELQFLGARD